jgi:hypothetical protein
MEERKKHSNDPDLLDVIEGRLYDRFPSWKDASGQFSEATHRAIHVHFKTERKTFSKAKDAYIWLVENMLKFNSNMKSRELEHLFVHGTHGGCYVAETLDELFHGDSNRIANPSYWHELSNGWFLNLNLNNNQKLDRLIGLAAVVGNKYNEDWSWRFEGEVIPNLNDFDELLASLGSER